jgi:hypothetical protein
LSSRASLPRRFREADEIRFGFSKNLRDAIFVAEEPYVRRLGAMHNLGGQIPREIKRNVRIVCLVLSAKRARIAA